MPIFTYRTCIWHFSWGWNHCSFIRVFCKQFVDFHVAVFAWWYVKQFW